MIWVSRSIIDTPYVVINMYEPSPPPDSAACVMQDLKLFIFNLQWFLVLGACFRVLGASFSSFGCFVFEIWVLRFRDLGASCFGLRFRVLRFRNYPTQLQLNPFLLLFGKRFAWLTNTKQTATTTNEKCSTAH